MWETCTPSLILLHSSLCEIVPILEKRLIHVLRLQTLEMITIAFLLDAVQICVLIPHTSPLHYRSFLKDD